MNNTILWIANRLRLSGSAGDNNSAGAQVAVIGVALAVVVMELTLCIVSGFKTEIRNKIIGFDSQITIDRPYDYSTGYQDEFITLNDSLLSIFVKCGIKQQPSLSLTLPAMIKTDENFSGALFYGHDSYHDFSFEEGNIISGVFPDYDNEGSENEIVISKAIANNLGLNVGEKLFVFFFVDNALKSRKATVAGIYESNLVEFDKTVIYSSLPFLQKVEGVDSLTGTHLDISGLEFNDIDRFGQLLQDELYHAVQNGSLEKLYPVNTVLQSGAIYFNWLSLLDTNVIVIFVLMMAVALFTLVSSLFLIILDRISMIGVFKSLGASNSMLSNLFLSIGLRLSVRGVIIGNIIGLSLCVVQLYTGFVKLDPQMYYLSEVPIRINVLPLVILNIAVIMISAMILYIPSRSVAKIDPTQSMRYE